MIVNERGTVIQDEREQQNEEKKEKYSIRVTDAHKKTQIIK